MMALNKYQTRTVIIIAVIIALVGVAFGSYRIGHERALSNLSSSSVTATDNSATQNTVNPNATKSTSPKSTSQSSSTPAPESSTGTCGDLTLTKGTSDGTAGTIYWHVVITNNGTQDCSLTGYPVATMTDSQGTSVSAQNSNLYPEELVTISAGGGKAHVVLGLPNPDNLDPATTICTEASSSTLHLELPGVAKIVKALFGASACQGSTVTAFHAGA